MQNDDLSQVESRVESLSGRVDELLNKLATASRLLGEIEKQVERLPSGDEWNDYCRAMPSASDLTEFAEVWDSGKLPTLDELKEYADVASEISAGLQAVE